MENKLQILPIRSEVRIHYDNIEKMPKLARWLDAIMVDKWIV